MKIIFSLGIPNFRLNHELEMILPEGIDDDKPEIYQQAIESNNYRSNKLWMGNCLRSIPASRGTMLEDFKNFKIKMRKGGKLILKWPFPLYPIKILSKFTPLKNSKIFLSMKFSAER